jgi:hypothetical protein
MTVCHYQLKRSKRFQIIKLGQLPTAISGALIGGEAPDFRAPLARESNL